MKHLLAALLVGTVPLLAAAQTSSTPAKAPAKAAAKPSAKAVADKPAGSLAAAKVAKGSKGKLAPSAVKAVEENTPLEEADPSVQLSEADLTVARKVHVGDFPCELGARIKVLQLKREGFFLVTTGKHRFRMHPVESRTGAIRLEDPHRGAMFLQLGNKSMLMSAKLGQRLADECQSPDQASFAESMKGKPVVDLLAPRVAQPQAIQVAAPPPAEPAPVATPLVLPADLVPPRPAQ